MAGSFSLPHGGGALNLEESQLRRLLGKHQSRISGKRTVDHGSSCGEAFRVLNRWLTLDAAHSYGQYRP